MGRRRANNAPSFGGAVASPSIARGVGGAAASATTAPTFGSVAASSVNVPTFGGEAAVPVVSGVGSLLNTGNGEQTESDAAETLSELGTYPADSESAFGATFENKLHELLSTGNVHVQLANADGESASEEQTRLLINAQAIAVQTVANNLQLEAVAKRVAQEAATAASDSNAALPLLADAVHKLTIAQTALATANDVIESTNQKLVAKEQEIAVMALQLKDLKDRHAEWISRVQALTSAEDEEIDKLKLAATEKKRKFHELATQMKDSASVNPAAAVQGGASAEEGEASAAGNAETANIENQGDM